MVDDGNHQGRKVNALHCWPNIRPQRPVSAHRHSQKPLAPIIHENRPWPKYKVGGHGCATSTYTCTAERCTAQISMCGTKMSGTWTGVTADIGVSVSGVRAGVMTKPLNCK